MMPSRTGLTWIDHVSSTQDVVLDHSTDLDHGAAAGTDDQRAGRGRNGRIWEAQPGQSVAVSTLLRPARRDPPLPAQRWPWITLSVAAAVVEVVRGWGVPASVKWPNDVMIYDDDGTGRKLAGILAQVTPDASGVVLGIGLNRDFSAGHRPSELAVALSDWMAPGELPDSPSLAETLRGTVLDAVDHLARSPNPVARVRPVMHTLGQRVRAELPGGVTLVGAASGLGESGTLLIEVEQVSAPEFDNASKSSATIDERAGIRGKIVTGETYEVSAADVVHLRPQHPPVESERVEGAARKTNMYDQNKGHRAGE